MPLLVDAQIHGLGGRAGELRDVLREHVAALRQAPGCLGAEASEALDADPGELRLVSWWRDEGTLRAHYATPAYTYYVGRIGELLARPSDVRVHHVDRSMRPVADLSADPTRQG